MHFRTLLAASVSALSLPASLHAQLPPRAPAAPAAQPAPPAKPLKDGDAAKLLEEIAKIGKALDELKYGHNARIIRELREAGVSGDKTVALWLDCMKEFEFDQKGKTATEFAEWKRRQTKDANRERDAALQLQVQWLAIVLMSANARTDGGKNEAVTAAVAFVDLVVENMKKTDGRLDIGLSYAQIVRNEPKRKRSAEREAEDEANARENVLNSVFAKHFKLDATTAGAGKENVVGIPGDVDAIYERMILPFYRDEGMSTSLTQAWHKRIEQETAIADAFDFPEAKEQFTAQKLPELKWGQAMEIFHLGQEEPAVQTMMGIIKTNSAHRKASQWLAEVTALLKPSPAKSPNSPPPAGPGPPAPGPARLPAAP